MPLEAYRTRTAAQGLAVRFPSYSTGGIAFITGRDGRTPPPAPETCFMRIAILDRRDDLVTSMIVEGRDGLNDWHRKHVGFRPDDEAPSPKPIATLISTVAEMFYLQQIGSRLTIKEFTNDLHTHIDDFADDYIARHEIEPDAYPVKQSTEDWLRSFGAYTSENEIPTLEIDDPDSVAAEVASIPLFMDAMSSIQASLPIAELVESGDLSPDVAAEFEAAFAKLQMASRQ